MKNQQKVLTVNGRLQAALVQNTLEHAGMPVSLRTSSDGAYLDVFVQRQHSNRVAGLAAGGCFSGAVSVVKIQS